VLPYLGARKLRDLTATEVDGWLATLAKTLSTRTLQGVRACVNRAVRRAMARDKVKRNVVELTEVPAGLPGRPSKVMTAQQADDVITKTASDRMHSYVVVSLLTGARTEELLARWNMFTWRGDLMLRRQFRPLSRCGDRYARAATQRPGSHAERSHSGLMRQGARHSARSARCRTPYRGRAMARDGLGVTTRLVPRWMLRMRAATSAAPWRQFLA